MTLNKLKIRTDITLPVDTPQALAEALAVRNLGWLTGCCTIEDHQDLGNLITVRPNSYSLFARVYCVWCGEFQRKINL